MAVYNGFSTRKKESVYNELTFDLMARLQEVIVAEMNGKDFDGEAWKKGYKVTVSRMGKMEKEKFMPPRYSQSCEELTNQMNNVNQKSNLPDKELPRLQGKLYIATVAKLLKRKFIK